MQGKANPQVVNKVLRGDAGLISSWELLAGRPAVSPAGTL
jgi:hypothetical protein